MSDQAANALMVKVAFGIGPVFALAVADGWWMAVGLAGYAVVTMGCAAATADHRGLSNLAAGLDLEIDVDEPSDTVRSAV